MDRVHGFLAGSKNNRKSRPLAVVVDNDAPASVDFLFARFSACHARYHLTKLEGDRVALYEAYCEFVAADLGEADARPLIALAEQRWGWAA